MGVKKRLFPHGIASNHTPACIPPACLPSLCVLPACLPPAVSQATVSRQMAECQAKVSPITGRIRRYKALRTEIQASRD